VKNGGEAVMERETRAIKFITFFVIDCVISRHRELARRSGGEGKQGGEKKKRKKKEEFTLHIYYYIRSENGLGRLATL